MNLLFWKSTSKASPKRLIDLETAIGDVELALAWCKKAIVDLNARMATIARKEKTPQDTPQPSNGDGSSLEHPLPQLRAARGPRRNY